MNLNIDFTGMAMLHLKQIAHFPKYTGTAYFLGGDHRPTLSVPLRHLKNVGNADVPKDRTRVIYPPGGPLLAEVDLKDLIVSFEDGAGTGDPHKAVVLAAHNIPPGLPPSPDSDEEWRDVGYALDLKFLAGTAEPHPDAGARSGASLVLDRGTLRSVLPLDEPMSEVEWTLVAPDGTTRKHKLTSVLRLSVSHGGNQFHVVLHDREGKKVGDLLLAPAGKETVPVAIVSLCNARGAAGDTLEDVLLYRSLLKDHPPLKAPTFKMAKISGDATQCPPAVLF